MTGPKLICRKKGRHRQFSAELTSIFHHSSSRKDRSLRASTIRVMGDVRHALLGFVKASALFGKIGLIGRALPAVHSPPTQAYKTKF